MSMNLKKEDMDRIFDGAQTVIEASHEIYNVMSDQYDAYSRRNAPNQPNNQPMYQQPVQYGYGYGDRGTTPQLYFGNNRNGMQNVYPGFSDPSYGNGGVW